jgi:effector-binding domain-containing protein
MGRVQADHLGGIMGYDVRTTDASPQLIAAVRARVRRGGVAQAFGSSLDKVWAFLRRHPGLRTDGHNLFLYEHGDAASPFLTVDFGVQVVAWFEQEGDVRCVQTPGGEIVTTVHRGPYDRLSAAHGAVHEWCRTNTRQIGGFSWEIYGDWTDDPERLETTIVYLLRP